jgi:hypothetical protein
VRVLALAVAAVLLGLACGCSSHARGGNAVPSPVTTISVPRDEPPSPSTWPAYPQFSAHSCWTRPFGSGVMRAAPSAKPPSNPPRTPPAQIVRRLLARLGDRRYVRGIELGVPPSITLQHLHGYFGGVRPPSDALWAYIDAPLANPRANVRVHPTPERVGALMVAKWETELVMGALRDDFCAAGGRPLIGSSIGNLVQALSTRTFALEQRFPNLSPRAFRRRVELIGRRYGFRIVSLLLLRPVQIAPLLVVETSRPRKAFVRDVPEIAALLNPFTRGDRDNALTFEGLLLEARDVNGPFVRVENVNRGEAEGGQWSWDPCVYPFGHSEPIGSKCP